MFWQRRTLILPIAAVVIGGLIGNSVGRLRVGAILHFAVPWEGPEGDGGLAMRCEVLGFAGFLAGFIQAAILCGFDGFSGD